MKKLIFVLLLCMVLLSACAQDSATDVVTYAPKTEQTEDTTEPTSESESEAEPSETASTGFSKMQSYEVTYSSVTTQRDSVGNSWINVLLTVQNTGSNPICLTDSSISIYADEELALTIDGAVCYPRVLEPGQVGYYFEQQPGFLEEGKKLSAQIDTNMENANQLPQFTVEDSQIYDAAFGIEIYGAFPTDFEAEGLLCVAAVLFDTEQKPFAVLCDYIEADANEFTLSSDKLPEGLSAQDVSSHVVYVYPYAG